MTPTPKRRRVPNFAASSVSSTENASNMSPNLQQSPSSADLTAFLKRYQEKRETAKSKILSDVSSMVDDMFDFILEEVFFNAENGGTLANALLERTQLFSESSTSFFTTTSTANSTISADSTIFASTPNRHVKTQQMTPTQENRKCPPRYSDSSPVDVGSISNVKNSKSSVIKNTISDDVDTVSSFCFSPESIENEAASDELPINLDGIISSLGTSAGESSQASSSNNDNTNESAHNNSDPDEMDINNHPSTSQASTSAVNCTSSPSPADGTISETVLQSHLKLNKAMFCIFYDGDGYFLCDIEEIPSSGKRSGPPFYKLYNVNVARLYKTFTKISHFLPFIRLPLKREQQNLQRKGRILVAWKEDDYLKPATIHEVYPIHGRVQVECDSGESGVIPIEDVWQLPEGAVIPLVTSITPSSALKPFIRDKFIADDIFNHYVEHKPSYSGKGRRGTDLEGAWRWEDSLGETSLYEHKIGGHVKAMTYKSVWKNDRAKFSVGDSVVIWHDYGDHSDTKPSFPMFGRIKHLYENISTKGKHVQFYWYIHPVEKENCQLKQLNGAMFISNDITTVDIDYLIGKVTVKTYGEFEASHPNWKYVIDDIRPYRDSLVENPIREYFTPGTFDYIKDVFIYDVDLLRRDDRDEFFREEEPAPPAKTTPKTKKRRTAG